MLFLALALFAGFASLGVWQVHRLAWKRDLIARVDARIRAPAAPAPAPGGFAAMRPKDAEYLRVSAQGRYADAATTLVRASTVHGRGFWVVTPLETDRGFTLLVNRGFIPEDRAQSVPASPGGQAEVAVTGLLRLSEPGGSLLQSNDPTHDRWYSRDVAAIAKARQLQNPAPYFIDAEARPGQGGLPIAGLTVVAFPNHHLGYAITWFLLAGLVAFGAGMVLRDERRLRQGRAD